MDLQWMNPACYDWATVCKTDSSFEHSHFSDHLAIITELDLPSKPLSDLQPRTIPNWETFKSHLSSELLPILESLKEPVEDFNVEETANAITSAISAAVTESTPTLTISHRTRRWWCARTLNPLKGHANNLRRKAQRTNSRADRVLY